MIKIIFEDNINSPSSCLLKSSYNGSNIDFTCGNNINKMIKTLNKYKGYKSIIFFDFPPNNERVYKNYEKLVDYIVSNNISDVHIVPIICIEYYIIKFLVDNNYLKVEDKDKDLISNLIYDFDYSNKSVNKFISHFDYRLNSLEHVYKDLLRLLVNKYRCMLNSNKYNSDGTLSDSYYGSFYTKDCACDRKFCRSNCSSSLSEKAERFYCTLPIFDVIDDNHKLVLESLNINFKDKDLSSLYDEIILFFSAICDSMNINIPLITRFE